jgi:hypothetical protein
MLNQNHAQKNIAAKLSNDQKLSIKNFIQGSIYCFCKNCLNRWFAARDLFGGENFYWGRHQVKLLNIFM